MITEHLVAELDVLESTKVDKSNLNLNIHQGEPVTSVSVNTDFLAVWMKSDFIFHKQTSAVVTFSLKNKKEIKSCLQGGILKN